MNMNKLDIDKNNIIVNKINNQIFAHVCWLESTKTDDVFKTRIDMIKELQAIMVTQMNMGFAMEPEKPPAEESVI